MDAEPAERGAATRRAALIGLVAGIAHVAAARADAIPGSRPSYTDRPLGEVPNAQAIGRRYWSPGLDEGFVPQGLTVFGDELLVAAYRSTDPRQDNGPSRVFRLALADGRLLGHFELPAAYGHPGGLAMRGSTLFVANSGRVLALRVPLDAQGTPSSEGEWRVERTMGPSFLSTDGDALWFGPFRREGEPKLYCVTLSAFAPGRTAPVTTADASRSLPLPLFAQGATFDRAGGLWISTSAGNRPAGLHRLDPASGTVLASYAAPGGIEDLGCAADGRLWAVSEAGTQRWNRWDTFFPLVFEIDHEKLVRRL